ncbi:MAG: hypothetical protein EAX95_06405 [Candidatus Thorarchaeota archaeon]|nr:hypothetical protein [Candidatus Thorarchaeota archaeon]
MTLDGSPNMSKFLLPFHEENSSLSPFSPAAMVVSTFLTAVMVTVQTNVLVVFVAILLILVGGTLARTRWRFVLSLAAKFEIVILFWVLLMPFLYGQTVAATLSLPIGVLNIYAEGIEFGLLLGFRMFALILLFISVLSHMTLSGFIGALRTLRIPSSILGSLLIMLRYIPLFIEERQQMQDAQSLRGFERGTRMERIKSLGFLVGSNIDRAFDRSIAVYESMKLRGFGGKMVLRGTGFRRADVLLVLLLLCLVWAIFVLIPVFLEVLFT